MGDRGIIHDHPNQRINRRLFGEARCRNETVGFMHAKCHCNCKGHSLVELLDCFSRLLSFFSKCETRALSLIVNKCNDVSSKIPDVWALHRHSWKVFYWVCQHALITKTLNAQRISSEKPVYFSFFFTSLHVPRQDLLLHLLHFECRQYNHTAPDLERLQGWVMTYILCALKSGPYRVCSVETLCTIGFYTCFHWLRRIDQPSIS